MLSFEKQRDRLRVELLLQSIRSRRGYRSRSAGSLAALPLHGEPSTTFWWGSPSMGTGGFGSGIFALAASRSDWPRPMPLEAPRLPPLNSARSRSLEWSNSRCSCSSLPGCAPLSYRTLALHGAQAEKAMPVRTCASYGLCDLGQAAKGLAVPGEALVQHHHPFQFAFPLADEQRAWIEARPVPRPRLARLERCLDQGGEARVSLPRNSPRTQRGLPRRAQRQPPRSEAETSAVRPIPTDQRRRQTIPSSPRAFAIRRQESDGLHR